MAGTRKHEDKTREQTCDNTKETNAEINTDRTQTLQNTCCYLYYLLPVPIYWRLVDCPVSLVGIFVSIFTIVTLNCNLLYFCLLGVLTSPKLERTCANLINLNYCPSGLA